MADNNLNANELEALMISELPTQATANETDLFEVAIVDANSASGYASKKESAAAIADAIVGQYQYPLRITGTTAKTIAGAINELKNLVDLLPQFAIEVVQTLPVSDISTTTIYLVPASDPEQGNYYEEYIYVNNAWELVGTTAVDLSGYYTSAQVDTLLAAKADTSSLATVATSGAYSDLSGKPTIDTALDSASTNAVENRAVAGAIEEIESEISSPDTSDNEPYLLRDSASGTADRMVDELVGGTIAWNQIADNNHAPSNRNNLTITRNSASFTVDGTANDTASALGWFHLENTSNLANHIILISNILVSGTISNNDACGFNVIAAGLETSAKVNKTILERVPTGISTAAYRSYWVFLVNTIFTNAEFQLQVIDLTQMFGATIADYIYSLEQAEAGAGVAFFRKLFPEDYYAYNAGELISVKATAHIMRDASDNIIGNYPLDANLELRGLFKLDANNKLYCDGDTYESSGKVTRKYGIVDLGDLTYYFQGSYMQTSAVLPNAKTPADNSQIANMICVTLKTVTAANVYSGIEGIGLMSTGYLRLLYTNMPTNPTAFKTAMNGVYLVYELATPTTETAASFAGIQVVDGDGTEEYVDSRAVPIPVGHNTTYIHGLNEYRTAVESYLASLDARITALENASSNRSLNVSQSLEKSVISPIETRTEEITTEEENAVTSELDTAEGKTEEETEEETKEEAQNER